MIPGGKVSVCEGCGRAVAVSSAVCRDTLSCVSTHPTKGFNSHDNDGGASSRAPSGSPGPGLTWRQVDLLGNGVAAKMTIEIVDNQLAVSVK